VCRQVTSAGQRLDLFRQLEPALLGRIPFGAGPVDGGGELGKALGVAGIGDQRE